MSPLLEFDDYCLNLAVDDVPRPVLRSVNFALEAGQTAALVGESGSGKSLTARSALRIAPKDAQTHGDIRFDGTSVLSMTRRELRRYRAFDVAMVFQDARAHINPVHTIGDFLCEGMVTSQGLPKIDARRRAISLLNDVGIADAESRLAQRPHQLSGGLLQRVMIAAALAADPRLIIADEPTTALDVTTQEEVVAILKERCADRGLALLFISHDLDLARAISNRLLVMYAGSIVEYAPADESSPPAHPYTEALLKARPPIDQRLPRLDAIPGRPISAFEAGEGCAFASRCPLQTDICLVDAPPLVRIADSVAACHHTARLVPPAREVLR